MTYVHIGHFNLAGLRDRRWNTLWDSLLRMYYQLDELGFRYIDGKVTINTEENDEGY